MTTSLSAPSLAEPLARALTFDIFERSYARAVAATLLTRLRADPATLTAVAEALHNITPECKHGTTDPHRRWKQCDETADRLLDLLLGSQSPEPTE